MLPRLACCLLLISPALATGIPTPALPGPETGLAAPPQSRKELRAELKDRMAKAGKDANALYAVALWAERKGLTSDAFRVCREVLKIDSNHAEARDKLGYVKHNEEWIKKDKLKAILKKERDAAMKAKGWVKHDGEWVDPKELRYAKLGFLKRDGEWVRKGDAKRIDDGYVQHPRIGVWIRKADLEKAEARKYPLPNDRWVDEAAANEAHSNWRNPWVLVEDDFALATTKPLEEASKLVLEVSSMVRTLKPILWESRLPLPRRFMIFIFDDADIYQGHGTSAQDEFAAGYSTYGAFYAPHHPNRPVAVNYAEKGWNQYFLRHAVGLGLSIVLFERAGLDSSTWLHSGIASYLERWQQPHAAKHFSGQYLAKGGVTGMKTFFQDFAINAQMTNDKMNHNLYQAGILFSFLFNGGSEAKNMRTAFDELKELIYEEKPNKRKAEKALAKFEKAAIQAQEDLKAHLQTLTK